MMHQPIQMKPNDPEWYKVSYIMEQEAPTVEIYLCLRNTDAVTQEEKEIRLKNAVLHAASQMRFDNVVIAVEVEQINADVVPEEVRKLFAERSKKLDDEYRKKLH